MRKIIIIIIILLLVGIIIAGAVALYHQEKSKKGEEKTGAPVLEKPEPKLPSIIPGDLYGNIEAVLPFAKKDLNKNYVFRHNFKKGETVYRNKIEKMPGVKLSVGEVGESFWQDKAAENPVTTQDFKAYVAINCTSQDFCLVSILGAKAGMRLDFKGIMLKAE